MIPRVGRYVCKLAGLRAVLIGGIERGEKYALINHRNETDRPQR